MFRNPLCKIAHFVLSRAIRLEYDFVICVVESVVLGSGMKSAKNGWPISKASIKPKKTYIVHSPTPAQLIVSQSCPYFCFSAKNNRWKSLCRPELLQDWMYARFLHWQDAAPT